MKRTCSGHTSKGKPCKRPPIHGGTVCPSHGGSAPQVRAKAEERVAEQEFNKAMRRELARLEVTPVTDPLTTLADLAGQALAFKDALASRVNDLQDNIRYEDLRGAEQLRSEIALWERALDRCERFCVSMAKLNIDERLAQVSEQQATLVADALAAVMGEMGLTRDQQQEARLRVASKLRVAAS